MDEHDSLYTDSRCGVLRGVLSSVCALEYSYGAPATTPWPRLPPSTEIHPSTPSQLTESILLDMADAADPQNVKGLLRSFDFVMQQRSKLRVQKASQRQSPRPPPRRSKAEQLGQTGSLAELYSFNDRRRSETTSHIQSFNTPFLRSSGDSRILFSEAPIVLPDHLEKEGFPHSASGIVRHMIASNELFQSLLHDLFWLFFLEFFGLSHSMLQFESVKSTIASRLESISQTELLLRELGSSKDGARSTASRNYKTAMTQLSKLSTYGRSMSLSELICEEKTIENTHETKTLFNSAASAAMSTQQISRIMLRETASRAVMAMREGVAGSHLVGVTDGFACSSESVSGTAGSVVLLRSFRAVPMQLFTHAQIMSTCFPQSADLMNDKNVFKREFPQERLVDRPFPCTEDFHSEGFHKKIEKTLGNSPQKLSLAVGGRHEPNSLKLDLQKNISTWEIRTNYSGNIDLETCCNILRCSGIKIPASEEIDRAMFPHIITASIECVRHEQEHLFSRICNNFQGIFLLNRFGKGRGLVSEEFQSLKDVLLPPLPDILSQMVSLELNHWLGLIHGEIGVERREKIKATISQWFLGIDDTQIGHWDIQGEHVPIRLKSSHEAEVPRDDLVRSITSVRAAVRLLNITRQKSNKSESCFTPRERHLMSRHQMRDPRCAEDYESMSQALNALRLGMSADDLQSTPETKGREEQEKKMQSVTARDILRNHRFAPHNKPAQQWHERGKRSTNDVSNVLRNSALLSPSPPGFFNTRNITPAARRFMSEGHLNLPRVERKELFQWTL